MMQHKIVNSIAALVLLFSVIPAVASPETLQPSDLPLWPGAPGGVLATQQPGPQTPNGFIVSEPTFPADTTGLPPAPAPQVLKGPVVEMPSTFPLPKTARAANAPHVSDPVLQSKPGQVNMPDPIHNWEGISDTGVQPPDTDGQVGPNHYVQIVNAAGEGAQIRVWDKNGNQLYDFGMNSMWPSGDRCNTYGYGDPVVLYDQLADRWILTQFTSPPSGPYNECFAISKIVTPTNNPSDWWLYTFNVHSTNFNDYPKIGVWPDGYYMMAHQFTNGSTWAGTGVWVFDRDKMLNGQAATFQYKDLYPMNPDYGGMLPSNLMGSNLPPAGSPNYYVEVDQTLGGANYVMTVFAFHVDWTTPTNTTFNVVKQFSVAPFDMEICPAARGQCIDQPGKPQSLEAISDRLMMHLWYRNFGDHETLVTNHTVDAANAPSGTNGYAGIRWYELRKTTPVSNTWSIYQQGTYAPDTNHRWMGSLAMDHVGDIALGYSVSSSSIYPGIRYAGRLSSDPLNTLSQAEATLVAGSNSFYGYRWGDYSAMSVDPVDDCTFWYTQEYIPGPYNVWHTRIGAWKFPNCEIGPQGALTGVVTDSSTTEPISGVFVKATSTMTQTGATTSGSDGSYLVNLPTGVYTVTASAYGYAPNAYTGIIITANTTTTLNIALDPLPSYVVSGTVRDARAGWPLYAKITIGGYPGAPIWTNPATGFYSVTLASGTNYNFDVSAFSPGYQAASQSVGPLSSNATVNLGLNVDQTTCNASGYEVHITGIYQTFDITTTPPGWNVTNDGGTCTWAFNDPGSRGNLTGGSGNFAMADSDWCGVNTTMSTTLYSPLVDVSSLPTITLSFNYDYFRYSSNEIAAVDVSANGGINWTNVVTWNTSQRGPALYSQDVTSLLGGSTKAQVRFRYVAGWDWWWEVDNVFMGTKDCRPKSGGLVVGNVRDTNTALGLNGATVGNQGGYSANTGATPLDPSVEDGFYALFSPAGAQVFSATQFHYATAVATITVPLSDTIQQDWSLGAGRLSYTPPAFDVSLLSGMTTTRPMTLTNSGNLTATFDIREGDKGGVPMMPSQLRPPYKPRVKPYWDPSETMTGQPTKTLSSPLTPNAWGTGAPIPSGARYRAAGASCDGKTYYVFGGANSSEETLNETWMYDPVSNQWTRKADMPVPLMNMEAACIDDYIYLVGGYTGSAHTNRFQIYDTATNTWVNSTWPNTRTPMTAAWNGKLYAFGGNPGPSAETWMYDPATATWTGPMAVMPTATSYGAATTMGDDIYVVGGSAGSSEVSAVQRYDPVADTWSSGPSLPVGRMSPMLVWYGNKLYAATGGDIYWNAYTNTLMLDTTTWPGGDWTAHGEAVPTPVIGAAYDCVNNRIYGAGGTDSGADYAINQYLDDGQICHFAAPDVPWLSESPISGTVQSASTQGVNVTFDSTPLDPGVYKAGLKFGNDTPYLVPNMPVTLTVNPPANWGKLVGTVNTLGACNVNTATLQSAQVVILGGATPVTLTTGISGTFQRWMIAGAYTLRVSAAEHQTATATVTVNAGQIITQNTYLNWLRPCASVSPLNFSKSLGYGSGLSATHKLTITNSGAATLNWSILEKATSQSVAQPTGSTERLNPRPPLAPQLYRPLMPMASVQDGGFEATNPTTYNNPYWAQYSQKFGTIICDATGCGTGGGAAGPHSGDFWAWFGGSTTGDTGWISQTVVFTPGVGLNLGFWLWIGSAATGPSDYMKTYIDNTPVYTADVATVTSGYQSVIVNVSAFADGNPHIIKFASYTAGSGNIHVDDVSLVQMGAACQPNSISWLSFSPASGTTAPGATSVLNVVMDSTGLQMGSYVGNVCVQSDDPLRPTIELPVMLTITGSKIFLPLLRK